jgi:dihydropteroate synthase
VTLGFSEPSRGGRTAVVGILNVTPDSFSDGGRHSGVDSAVEHGLAMVAAGADVVDVGGESTRPGAARVSEAEELHRVVPVVRALAGSGVAVSIDTMRASVARAAIRAGAVLVNDVSGGLADPRMAHIVAEANVPWVLVHWRGHSHTMDSRATYHDVVAEVQRELMDRVDAATGAGICPDRLVLDPGFGFAKRAEHDIQLLAQLDQIVGLGFPVLAGTSRKRFIGAMTSRGAGPPPAIDRDAATLATVVVSAQQGAWGVRVHNVRGARDAVDVISALHREGVGSHRHTN